MRIEYITCECWLREWIVCLLTRAPSGHYYVNDVWPYVRISDRIRFAGSDWVKWVKVLRRFVGVIRVRLELGFEGVNWVNKPVLLGGASPNRTDDLSQAVGAVKSLTTGCHILIPLIYGSIQNVTVRCVYHVYTGNTLWWTKLGSIFLFCIATFATNFHFARHQLVRRFYLLCINTQRQKFLFLVDKRNPWWFRET